MTTWKHVNQKQARGRILAREPFRASALSGAPLNVGLASQLGYLPPEYRVQLSDAFKKHGRQLYVVWSYVTPIAWIAPECNVTIPDVKYSATTSRHQAIVRRALGGY